MSLILQQVQSLCRQHRDAQSCHDSGYTLIDLGIQLIASSDQYQGVFLFPFDPFQDIPCFLAQTRLIATLCLLCCRRGAPQSMRCHLRKILPHEGKQRLMVMKRDLRVIEWNTGCRNLLLHLLCQYIPIGCMCRFINIRLFFPPRLSQASRYHRAYIVPKSTSDVRGPACRDSSKSHAAWSRYSFQMMLHQKQRE